MKKPSAVDGPGHADLFERLFTGVTPLPAHDRVIHPRVKRKPVPREVSRPDFDDAIDDLSDHFGSSAIANGEEPVFLRNGLSAQTHKKLRRGHWKIDAELDLHGQRSTEARALLVEFLHHCQAHGARCVRIIHGKGLRSTGGEPVLKAKVANWLMQRPDVLAFCSARQTEGGAGALMVLLKRESRVDD